MTVTRALAKLKVLESRIEKAIVESEFVSICIGKGANETFPHGQNKDNLSRKIQGNFDQVESLIADRDAIKTAILASNSITNVKVGEKYITVADAIYLKKSIESKKKWLTQLRLTYDAATKLVNKTNTTVDTEITNAVNAASAGSVRPPDEIYDLVSTGIKDKKFASVFDPCNILDKIAKLQKEVEEVECELDFTLSEANSVTRINVDIGN